MNYPLISEYVEAIKAAEDNFDQLNHLRPVLGDDGLPVMTSGNFAVVFKMKDEQSGKLYAVKCFTKEQEGRAEAYREIAKELKDVSSPYLVSIRYLEKELFVDTDQTTETEFPVLLMDWVEGKTLEKYLRENLDDKYALEMLAYRFSQLAQWLIPQPFAHGDLKPDNILVREDGTLVLVDYDGMYVPAMKGQKARELGSPDFRHPLRTENDFDERIDNLPLVSILFSLKAISVCPQLLEGYGEADRLLLAASDYTDIDNNNVVNYLSQLSDATINSLISVLVFLCHHWKASIVIPTFKKPFKKGKIGKFTLLGINFLSEPPHNKLSASLSIDKVLENLMVLDDLMKANGIDYVLTGSLGLYLHGIVPTAYTPHDIDIIVINNKSNHPSLTSEKILDLFVQYCGSVRSKYSYYDASETFVFYIGRPRIEISAFFDRHNLLTSLDYRIVYLNGRNIKLNNVLSIFKKKYELRRLKDYQFNNDVQLIMNGFLNPINQGADSTQLSNCECKCLFNDNFNSQDDLLLSKDVVTANDNEVNDGYADDSSVIYSKDKCRLLKCLGYKSFYKPFPQSTHPFYCIPEGTKVICELAFAGCDYLEEISIPLSVRVIGNAAFANTNLKYIYIPNSHARFFENPFVGYSGRIHINSMMYTVIAERNCEESEYLYHSVLSQDMKTIIHCGYSDKYYYGGCYKDESWETEEGANPYKIPMCIETIGECAFACCDLSYLKIPEGVKVIKDWAFYDSKIQIIHFPKTIEYIGHNIFGEHSLVKKIFIPQSSIELFDNLISTYKEKVQYY